MMTKIKNKRKTKQNKIFHVQHAKAQDKENIQIQN